MICGRRVDDETIMCRYAVDASGGKMGADFNLTDPASAYVFGFMQADGHHYSGKGRKGRISVEIKADDAELLYAMQAVIPWPTSVNYRTRTTNFAASAHSAVLNLCLLEARTRLLELGLPTGRK